MKTYARSWRVGPFTAELKVPALGSGSVAHATCEWRPFVPPLMTRAMRRQYEAGRARAIKSILAEMRRGR